MGNSANPWGTLSDMIRKKVADQRERKQKVEDETRDNQMKIIMAGIQAHAQNGTLTDEMIQNSQEQMQKLVPKDSVPIVEAYHKVMGQLGRKNKGKSAGPGSGPTSSPTSGPTSSPASTQNASPAAQNQPQPAGTSGGGQPVQPTPPTAPKPDKPQTPGMFPSAIDMGRAAGQSQQAQEQVLSQSRQAAIGGLKAKYEKEGRKMSPEMEQALDMWAIGAPAGAVNTLSRHNLHPVVVKGPNNSRIPAIQNEVTGEVYGPDGNTIENPEVVPSSGAKPRIGWAKDSKGYYSFAVDPYTNQPIPNTEDHTALPPSYLMDKIRVGHYFYTDDSGGVHEIPNVTRTGVNAPTSSSGLSAVPPGMRKPTSKTSPGAVQPGAPSLNSKHGPSTTDGGAPAKSSTSSSPRATPKSDIVGSKDTGVLSPAAQKVVMTTQPVLEQANRLKADIERLNLQDNNTAGYLFTDRLKYKFGKASPNGTLGEDIAGLSLGSVIEAASSLQGSSRSIAALKKALQHTPNPWVDSPKVIYNKLNEITARLQDVVDDANTVGRKRQSSPEGASSGATAVPKSMQKPGKAKTADQEAEEYLAAH